MSAITQEIKDKLDLVTFVSQTVQLKKVGQSYVGLCCWHNERTPSLYISPEHQTYRCFGCGKSGDLISFVMEKENLSFGDTIKRLATLAGIALPNYDPQHEIRLHLILESAVEHFHNNLRKKSYRAIFDYTQQRSIGVESIRAWKLGYSTNEWRDLFDAMTGQGFSTEELLDAGLCGKAEKNGKVTYYDRFRNRLMFPIYNETSKVIGFGARAMGNDTPKYLNTAQTTLFDKSATLYGLNVAKNAIVETGQAVIVEGYLDCLTAHQNGYTNVVAQMGTSLTDIQLRKLMRYTDNIVIALDGDSAGQKAASRGVELAAKIAQADRLSLNLKVVSIPGNADPDEFLRERSQDWPMLLESARPSLDYVIDRALLSLKEDSRIAREALARKLLPIVLSTEQDLSRQANAQYLAQRLNLPERAVMELVASNIAKVKTNAKFAQLDAKSGIVGLEHLALSILVQNPNALPDLQRGFTLTELSSFESSDLLETDHRLIFEALCVQEQMKDDLKGEYELLKNTPVDNSQLYQYFLYLKRDSLIRQNQEIEQSSEYSALFAENMRQILIMSRAIL